MPTQSVEDLGTIPETLPVFESEDWQEHVEAWRAEEDKQLKSKWEQAAIAANLTAVWGERTAVIERFAHEAKCSARRVYEYAYTYRAFQSRERSQILTFSHHTKAARSADPQRAIDTAEVQEFSTRELDTHIDTQIGRVDRETGEVVTRQGHYERCPNCGQGQIFVEEE
jgi:hypothetical protein